MMTTSSLGRESFRIRVRAIDYDPTTGDIDFSFPAEDVAPAAWAAGAWIDPPGTLEAGDVYWAYAQTPTVGEGTEGATVDLAPGTYDVWARLTTVGEIIVRLVDQLTVT